MDLHHFTKQDWDTYCGCQSENPLIGWARGAGIVVDGNYVELYSTSRGPVQPEWVLEFPDVGMAMMFALDFRGDEPDHIIKLKAARYGRVEQTID
jgi:hypothetical protein